MIIHGDNNSPFSLKRPQLNGYSLWTTFFQFGAYRSASPEAVSNVVGLRAHFITKVHKPERDAEAPLPAKPTNLTRAMFSLKPLNSLFPLFAGEKLDVSKIMSELERGLRSSTDPGAQYEALLFFERLFDHPGVDSATINIAFLKLADVFRTG
jgi:hypothetical protein